jgi:hypothetical protein
VKDLVILKSPNSIQDIVMIQKRDCKSMSEMMLKCAQTTFEDPNLKGGGITPANDVLCKLFNINKNKIFSITDNTIASKSDLQIFYNMLEEEANKEVKDNFIIKEIVPACENTEQELPLILCLLMLNDKKILPDILNHSIAMLHIEVILMISLILKQFSMSTVKEAFQKKLFYCLING